MDEDAYNAICEVIEDQTHALTPAELDATLRAVIEHCRTQLEGPVLLSDTSPLT